MAAPRKGDGAQGSYSQGKQKYLACGGTRFGKTEDSYLAWKVISPSATAALIMQGNDPITAVLLPIFWP